MSYSFFMSIFNIPIFILQLVKLTLGQMRHLISTFVARVQILGTNALLQARRVTGPLMWAVFFGFTQWGMCAAQTLVEQALQDWDAQQFFCT